MFFFFFTFERKYLRPQVRVRISEKSTKRKMFFFFFTFELKYLRPQVKVRISEKNAKQNTKFLTHPLCYDRLNKL